MDPLEIWKYPMLITQGSEGIITSIKYIMYQKYETSYPQELKELFETYQFLLKYEVFNVNEIKYIEELLMSDDLDNYKLVEVFLKSKYDSTINM